jgi:hypothetical protein
MLGGWEIQTTIFSPIGAFFEFPRLGLLNSPGRGQERTIASRSPGAR